MLFRRNRIIGPVDAFLFYFLVSILYNCIILSIVNCFKINQRLGIPAMKKRLPKIVMNYFSFQNNDETKEFEKSGSSKYNNLYYLKSML